jgi:hypothetical protein
MKAFTIDAESNITVFPSRAAAETNLPPAGAFVFTTAAGLDGYLKKFPAAAAVEIWNSLTGATPVAKFKDRATAVSRIWKAIQTLGEADPVAVPDGEPETAPVADQLLETSEAAQPEAATPVMEEPAPATTVAPQTPDVAPEAAPAKTKVARAKKADKPATDANGPREGSKTSQVIAMLNREGETTLEEIMTAMGWLKHTTRAMLSAGGSLTKKHGLTIISEKFGDKRTYRIAK